MPPPQKSKSTPKPKNVRIAGPEDREALFWHCMQGYHDSGMAEEGLPFSPMRVLQTVTACVAEDPTVKRGIAGIIDGPVRPLGSIGIVAMQLNFSETWLLSEAWIYTDPAARKGSRIGEKLMQFALWHREDMSARLGYDIPLEITLLTTVRLDAKVRFAQRYGKTVGTTIWVRGDDWAKELTPP